MVITMARGKKLRLKSTASFYSLLILFPMAILPNALYAAETKFTPLFKTGVYSYEIETSEPPITDQGGAWALSPGLTFDRESALMQTRLTWQHDSLLYEDEQRDRRHYNEFQLSNTIFGFNKRLSWQLSAQQSYQVLNSRLGVFSDNITGGDNLTKSVSYATSLGYTNSPSAKYITEVTLQVAKSKSEPNISDSEFTAYDGMSYNTNLRLGTNSRGLNFFWLVDSQFRENTREDGADISGYLYNIVVGVPFAPKFSFIGRMGHEQADNGSSYDNSYEYFGGGVEYRFGARSRINVAMNRSDTKTLGQNTDTNTYVSSDFLFAPTRRTSLEGSFDRRYFGRTMQLSGNYAMKFLTVRLSFAEDVRTQNLFDNELVDLGIFVCQDGANSLDGCFKPPSNQYVPVFGESLQQVSITDAELRQELVKSNSETVNIAYSKNRLAINLILSNIDTEYVETGDTNSSLNRSLQVSWLLNANNKVLTDFSYYNISYDQDLRQDKNISASVSYQRTMTDRSDAKLTFRRLDRNSNQSEFDNAENRVWLEYQYRF